MEDNNRPRLWWMWGELSKLVWQVACSWVTEPESRQWHLDNTALRFNSRCHAVPHHLCLDPNREEKRALMQLVALFIVLGNMAFTCTWTRTNSKLTHRIYMSRHGPSCTYYSNLSLSLSVRSLLRLGCPDSCWGVMWSAWATWPSKLGIARSTLKPMVMTSLCFFNVSWSFSL